MKANIRKIFSFIIINYHNLKIKLRMKYKCNLYNIMLIVQYYKI